MSIKRPSVAMLNKLDRVIRLCTTVQQLDGARKYCKLYVETLPYSDYMINFSQFLDNESVIRMLNGALNSKRMELNDVKV